LCGQRHLRGRVYLDSKRSNYGGSTLCEYSNESWVSLFLFAYAVAFVAFEQAISYEVFYWQADGSSSAMPRSD
jgi:hypothetical protein